MSYNKYPGRMRGGLRVVQGPSMRLLVSSHYKGVHTLPEGHPDYGWMKGLRTVMVCSQAISQLAGWMPRRMHLEFQIGEVWPTAVRGPKPDGWWFIPLSSNSAEPRLAHTPRGGYRIYSGFHIFLLDDLGIVTDQLFKIVMVVEEV